MVEPGGGEDLGRIALCLEYDGSGYHGWQSQRDPHVPTIQDKLESALSRVADHQVKVACAGRTDAGVHATNQVVHFESSASREPRAWVNGGNSWLPDDIAIRWARPVSQEFHARFSALSRRYRYVIYNEPVRPALFANKLTWEKYALNEQLMHEEAQCLLGELDFSSFRGVACQSNSPYRNVHHVTVSRSDRLVTIEIQANAFVLHMVRNIAGVLMAVGSGLQQPGWTRQVLEARDRTAGGVTAPAAGLYLVNVDYPQHYGLPRQADGPLFCL
jgi:tRNA pseudouridine38-40 synthase